MKIKKKYLFFLIHKVCNEKKGNDITVDSMDWKGNNNIIVFLYPSLYHKYFLTRVINIMT